MLVRISEYLPWGDKRRKYVLRRTKMFGRKKQTVNISASKEETGGTAAATGLQEQSQRGEQKVRAEKLPGPANIDEVVGRYLVTQKNKDPDWVWHLKSVICPDSGKGRKAFDIRIYEESRIAREKIKVRDWTTFDQHPELLVFEGWFDKDTKKVELEEKTGKAEPVMPASGETYIFTEDEIWRRIISLEPGKSAMFYLSGSSVLGGPLGRGAAIIELNPDYPGQKQKRYIVYVTNVDAMEPVGEKQKFFETDRSKEIATWIKERHKKAVS